jgi:hypothetical protein
MHHQPGPIDDPLFVLVMAACMRNINKPEFLRGLLGGVLSVAGGVILYWV